MIFKRFTLQKIVLKEVTLNVMRSCAVAYGSYTKSLNILSGSQTSLACGVAAAWSIEIISDEFRVLAVT